MLCRVVLRTLVLPVAVALVFCGGAVSAQTFTPGDVFWSNNVTPSECINVTGGGDFTGVAPFTTTARPPGQYAWNATLDTAWLTQFDSGTVVRIDATGTVNPFASGLGGVTGLLRTQAGTLLAADFGTGRVFDITAGGDFTGAPPFAFGLSGPRNLVQLSTGQILVAEQGSGDVMDITAGGDFSAAIPFATGLGLVADLVQNAAGNLYVTQYSLNQVMDITAGGDFSAAAPFAFGQSFMGLAIDGAGRLLANELLGTNVWDITAGGDFSAAAPWAFGLPQPGGESAFDSVPPALVPPTIKHEAPFCGLFPFDITVDQNENLVIVNDLFSPIACLYDLALNPLGQIPAPPGTSLAGLAWNSNDGLLYWNEPIAGNLWVTDNTGTVVTVFPGFVSPGGGLMVGMTFDHNTRTLWVCDRDTNDFYEFTKEGVFTGNFFHSFYDVPPGLGHSGWGIAWRDDNRDFEIPGGNTEFLPPEEIAKVDSAGNETGAARIDLSPFGFIRGLAFHPLGSDGRPTLYLADSDAGLVYEINALPKAAQPCEPPNLECTSDCVSLRVDITITAKDRYQDVVVVVLDAAGGVVFTGSTGPLMPGEVFNFNVTLPQGVYIIQAQAICNDGTPSDLVEKQIVHPDVTTTPLVWGVRPSTGEIVTIDPFTGLITGAFPAPDPLAPGQIFQGLSIAEGGNTLIYINVNVAPNDLYRLDPVTGAVFTVENLPIATPAALSFQSGPDRIFTIDNGTGVFRQDGYGGPISPHLPNGPTFPGAQGGDDQGREFVAALVPGGVPSIVEYDPNVPNTVLNAFPFPPGVQAFTGLAFDGTNLYASDDLGNLFTLDPNTGAVLNVVPVPNGPLTGLGAKPADVACEPVRNLFCESPPGSNRVDLFWENNVDYRAINIFRDGVFIAGLPGSATFYNDEPLPSGIYTYTVEAVCCDGTPTTATCTVEVIRCEPVRNLVCVSEPNSNRVDLFWENNVPYQEIRIVRDGVLIDVLPGNATSYNDSPVPAGVYVYLVLALCVDGTLTEVGCTVEVIRCEPVRNLECFSEPNTNRVDLIWENNVPYEDILIVREGAIIAILPGDATSYNDPDVPEGIYEYCVIATCLDGTQIPVCCIVEVIREQEFIRGDVNRDGTVNIADSIYLLNFLFVPGSPPPNCEKSADINRDCAVNIADAVYLLNFLFVQGPPPSAPFPDCGTRADCPNLTCDSFAPCP